MIRTILLVIFLATFSLGYSQVIINETTTSLSSAFTVASSDKGILIPKVSLPSINTLQLDGLNTNAEGLLIYNTNDSTTGGDGKGFYLFNSSLMIWEKVLTPKATIGVLPIGSIIAWHNRIDFPYLTLPQGWQLCDGSVISDTNSPLNGIATPDLNGTTTSESGDTSQGRFLRGSQTSGDFQTDQVNNLNTIEASGASGGSTNVFLNQNGNTALLTTDDWNGTTFGGRERYGFQLRGVENRAVNMSVQYIMRIK